MPGAAAPRRTIRVLVLQPFRPAGWTPFKRVMASGEAFTAIKTFALVRPSAVLAPASIRAITSECPVALRADGPVADTLSPFTVSVPRLKSAPSLLQACFLVASEPPEQIVGALLTDGPCSREQGVNVDLGHWAPARCLSRSLAKPTFQPASSLSVCRRI